MIYFAYGSNTNPKVMIRRVPESVYCGTYVLKGWKLRFAGSFEVYNGKGALDIQKCPMSEVKGVLWHIPNGKIEYLDTQEPDYKHYIFNLDSGDKCYTYTMSSDIPDNKPKLEYLKKVSEGYKIFKLPLNDLLNAYLSSGILYK